LKKSGKPLLKRTSAESGMNALHVAVRSMAEACREEDDGDDGGLDQRKQPALDDGKHGKKRSEKKSKKERSRKELKKERSNTDMKKKSPRRMILKSPRKHMPATTGDATELGEEQQEDRKKEQEEQEREETRKRKKLEEEAALLAKLRKAEAQKNQKENEEKLMCVAFLLKVQHSPITAWQRALWLISSSTGGNRSAGKRQPGTDDPPLRGHERKQGGVPTARGPRRENQGRGYQRQGP
jgi:hypothetical protein